MTHRSGGGVRAEDVRAAYRLLLGREPDPDGWRNFHAMVGVAPVSELVGSFLSSEEFRRTPMHRAMQRQERDDLDLVAIGQGLQLFVSPHDLLNDGIRQSGAYETHLDAALARVLVPGMRVCCVGANIGYHAIRTAARVGDAGRVLAFEAHPGNAQLVIRSLALNGIGNTVVLPFAVADSRSIYRYVAAQGTNGYIEPLSPEAGSGDVLRESTLVQSLRLDDLVGFIGRVDVLQMDVEGAEGRVLAGASSLLSECRPTIFSELCLGQLSRNSAIGGEDFLAILQRAGYRFTALGFDGVDTPFGASVDRLCAYARAQRTSHIDIRCDAG